MNFIKILSWRPSKARVMSNIVSVHLQACFFPTAPNVNKYGGRSSSVVFDGVHHVGTRPLAKNVIKSRRKTMENIHHKLLVAKYVVFSICFDLGKVCTIPTNAVPLFKMVYIIYAYVLCITFTYQLIVFLKTHGTQFLTLCSHLLGHECRLQSLQVGGNLHT